MKETTRKIYEELFERYPNLNGIKENILNAFNALGVDGVNLATDHMLDFGKDVFKDT